MSDTQSTDGELIEKYKANRDELAAKILLQRHYNTVLKRLRSKLSLQDAEDCAQLFWTRFFNNIDNYKDSDRFEHYLSASVSNLLKEHWRNSSTSSKYVVPAGSNRVDDEQSDTVIDQFVDASVDLEEAVINEELIDYLVNTLIPDLPAEQRLLWLLNHESEFWDPEQPLSWATLAQLNGITPEVAWDRFEAARNDILVCFHKQTTGNIDPEHLLVYLVWTQAQRFDKRSRFTMKYFAMLLNEPENTLKTRYRTTKARLDSDLSAFANPVEA